MKSSYRIALSFKSGYEFRLLMSRGRALPAFRTRNILPFLLVTLVMSGCDKNQFAPLDSKNTAPIVSTIFVNPDSIYIDNLTPSNGQYSISTNVRVAASDGDGPSDLVAVTADVVRPDGTLAASGVMLHDDGIAPDSVAGDGLYSGTAQFTLIRAQAGRYRIRGSASDLQGAISNSLQNVLKLSRRNSPPTVFNLDAPDSVTRPSTGSLLFSMTIAASDSDGLPDVSEVYFRSLNSSDPTVKFFLYDDGSTVLRSGVLSGDQLAGDGIFTITVQLPFDALPGERLFAFQCLDTFGDTSAVLLHPLIVE